MDLAKEGVPVNLNQSPRYGGDKQHAEDGRESLMSDNVQPLYFVSCTFERNWLTISSLICIHYPSYLVDISRKLFNICDI